VNKREQVMPTAEENKATVGTFLANGVSSDASIAMVTDDFRWVGPRSMEFLFEGAPAREGGESLRDIPFLDKALYRGYDPNAENSSVHFMIAEGDIVVMEFDAAFTGWEGEKYHNFYCLVFVLRDGKIAEVREHADTKYVWNTLLDTPDKQAAVSDRLRLLRAGEEL
jgi:ketosteroid isomerase-like protein